MIETLKTLSKDHLLLAKLLTTLMIFWASGMLVGTSILGHGALRLNHPILMAQATAPSEDHTLVAVHTEKLDEMTKANQAGFDDRKELHAALVTLTDRLNVDEAQFKTIGWILGTLLSLFNGVLVVLAVLDYRNKRRHAPSTQ